MITDLAVMRFDEETRRMYLSGVYPGIELESIKEKMSFDVDMSRAEPVPSPSARRWQRHPPGRCRRDRCVFPDG